MESAVGRKRTDGKHLLLPVNCIDIFYTSSEPLHPDNSEWFLPPLARALPQQQNQELKRSKCYSET
jgi:hypothetical protein